jgi:hypothetical protein
MKSVARDEWNIGVVPQTVADIALNGITRPVHWLTPIPGAYWPIHSAIDARTAAMSSWPKC